MPDEYAESWIVGAAAKGVPCFWNASGSSDLSLIAQGADVYLQVSAGEFGAAGHAERLAPELLAKTGAAGVIVTDGERPACGLLRGDKQPLHAPTLPVAEPIRELGAGDAHFAGFLAAFSIAPPATRLERGLAAGRIAAARHVLGLKPGTWTDLVRFEASLDHVPAIQRGRVK